MINLRMDKTGVQAMIKNLPKKGITSKKIHEERVQILAEDYLFYATVKKWDAKFKWGRDSTEDDHQSVCTNTS